MRGVLVGIGGPDIMVGSAATKGTHQTALSMRLSPPKKWSYLKLVVGLVVVSFIALIAYVHSVMASSSISSSLGIWRERPMAILGRLRNGSREERKGHSVDSQWKTYPGRSSVVSRVIHRPRWRHSRTAVTCVTVRRSTVWDAQCAARNGSWCKPGEPR